MSGTAVEGKIFRIYTFNFLNLNQVDVLIIFKNYQIQFFFANIILKDFTGYEE